MLGFFNQLVQDSLAFFGNPLPVQPHVIKTLA